MNKQTKNQNFSVDSSNNTKYVFLFTHGAGAGMDHHFMQSIAHSLSLKNATVVRFNFSYMSVGKKFPTSSQKSIADIDQAYQQVQSSYPDVPIFIGGKSYGGRMSSHWLAEQSNQHLIRGLIYLGFPLHAPGKPSIKRADHLSSIQVSQLFLQGTKDKLADNDLIDEVISKQQNASLFRVDHADHSFKMAKKYGKSEQEIIEELAMTINKWALSQLKST